MLRGYYAAASGMLSQQRRTDMLTNNMANANTPGFKADQSSLRAFPEMLLQQMGTTSIPSQNPQGIPVRNEIGGINSGVYMQEAMPKFSQGDLQETGNQTDLALVEVVVPTNDETNTKGALFFTIQNQNGDTRYTRNGNFTIDSQGYITTNEGYYLLDENANRIFIESGNFKVASDGTIMENDETVATLNVAFADDPNNLVKEGNGLFRANDGVAFGTAIDNQEITYNIQQGFLERSNVDVSQTMTEMMTAFRAFEANQKILQAYDKSMDKAVNDIGRLR